MPKASCITRIWPSVAGAGTITIKDAQRLGDTLCQATGALEHQQLDAAAASFERLAVISWAWNSSRPCSRSHQTRGRIAGSGRDGRTRHPVTGQVADGSRSQSPSIFTMRAPAAISQPRSGKVCSGVA